MQRFKARRIPVSARTHFRLRRQPSPDPAPIHGAAARGRDRLSRGAVLRHTVANASAVLLLELFYSVFAATLVSAFAHEVLGCCFLPVMIGPDETVSSPCRRPHNLRRLRGHLCRGRRQLPRPRPRDRGYDRRLQQLRQRSLRHGARAAVERGRMRTLRRRRASPRRRPSAPPRIEKLFSPF